MPFQRERYPKDWLAISTAIRARAGGCCEGTWQYPQCQARNGEPHPVTGSRVILTVAHWPNSDPMDVRPENLRALCQRCHLGLDRDHHAANARRPRALRLEQDQRDLFGEVRAG